MWSSIIVSLSSIDFLLVGLCSFLTIFLHRVVLGYNIHLFLPIFSQKK